MGDRGRECAALNVVIGEQVLFALGEPEGLHHVPVRRLWQDHRRVNVFVGADAACAKLAHSFFLVADQDAKIVPSTPTIRKEYAAVAG